MGMNKFMKRGTLALASMVICATPALPSTITMNFGTIFQVGKSGITPNGTGVTGVGFSFAGGTLGGFSESNLSLTDVNNTWTLAGTWDGVSSTSLLTFTNTPTNNSTTMVANYGGTTTLGTINSSLAAALGIVATGDSLSIGAGSLNYTASSPVTVNSTPYTNTVTSPTLLLTLTGAAAPTPEPASFFMMGSGLMFAGLVFRNRRKAVKSVA
jgi:hypothetical protein